MNKKHVYDQHLLNEPFFKIVFRDARFVVLDYAEFPGHVTVQHLRSELLGLPSNSFLLHLSKSQAAHSTAMIVVPDSR